jgi:hypothetical protein
LWAAAWLAGARAAGAQPELPLISGTDQEYLIARGYVRHDPAAVDRILGPYRDRVAREGIVPADLYVASATAIECVVGRALSRNQTIAELFTDALFLKGGRLSFIIDPAGLATIDDEFDFHTIFPIATRLRDGNAARMTFLLVGQGTIVVGYDRAGTYSHRDAEYRVFGWFDGYDLDHYVRMNVGRSASGARTITGLATASGPGSNLGPFLGPGDFQVSELSVVGPTLILRHPSLTLRPRPIAARNQSGEQLKARLMASGCPSTGEWNLPGRAER